METIGRIRQQRKWTTFQPLKCTTVCQISRSLSLFDNLAGCQTSWQNTTRIDEKGRRVENKQTKKHVHLINCLRNPCLKTRLIYLIKFNCMSSSLTRQTWMRLRDGFLLRQVPLHQWKLPLLANSQCCRCAFLVGHLRNQVLWYGDLHQTAEQWSEERLC